MTRRQRYIEAVAYKTLEIGRPTREGARQVMGSTNFQWEGFREEDLTFAQESALIGAVVRRAEEIHNRLRGR